VAASGGVVGTDAHKPVDTAFGAQEAVGVRAFDQQGGVFDAGFLTGAVFHDFVVESLLFAVTGVHAQHHVGPVVGLGSAGAGVDVHVGVVGVEFAAKQRHHFEFGLHLGNLSKYRLGFDRKFLEFVLTGAFREFDQSLEVFNFPFERCERIEEGFEAFDLRDGFLRGLLVIPEVRAGLQRF